MWLTGLVAPRHVGSSQTRARTRVPCIGRQILNLCATREAREQVLSRQNRGCPHCPMFSPGAGIGRYEVWFLSSRKTLGDLAGVSSCSCFTFSTQMLQSTADAQSALAPDSNGPSSGHQKPWMLTNLTFLGNQPYLEESYFLF